MKTFLYLSAVAVLTTSAQGKALGSTWADSVLASLSLEQKIGQLVFPGLRPGQESGESDAWLDAEKLIVDYGVGGFVLFGGTYPQVLGKLATLQKASGVPLLIASDFERGAGQKIRGATVFPPNMALGAAGSNELAYRVGYITGLQARKIGVHLTLSPVLDVNNNPANPIINVRSFGEDPEAVSDLGASYIRGCKKAGLLPTAKHFPGHGDTGVDSHTGLPVIGKSRKKLEKMELLPFRKAIELGVDAVMIGHLSVPSLDSTGTPASVSRAIVKDFLRKEMGFEGLVVTDALMMDALKEEGVAGAVCDRALKAGADILLMPGDVPLCVSSLLEAVREGAIDEKIVDESVRHILEAKGRVFRDTLTRQPSQATEMRELIADGEAVARELAMRSITLLSNENKLVPVDIGYGKVISITVRGDTFLPDPDSFHRAMRAELGERYSTFTILPESDSLTVRRAIHQAKQADILILIAVSQVRAYQGYPGLPEKLISFAQDLISDRNTILVSLGNPYLIRNFPGVSSTLIAFGTDRHSQRAAAQAVLGKAPVNGRLPVTIPDRYKAGSGLSSEGRGRNR